MFWKVYCANFFLTSRKLQTNLTNLTNSTISNNWNNSANRTNWNLIMNLQIIVFPFCNWINSMFGALYVHVGQEMLERDN